MTLKFTSEETITRYHDWELEVNTEMMETFKEDGYVETFDDFLDFIRMNYYPIQNSKTDSEWNDVKFAENAGFGKGNAEEVFNFLKGRHQEIHIGQ